MERCRGRTMRAAINAALVLNLSIGFLPAMAKTHRDPTQRAAFVRVHPCPSTGKTKGQCPGYLVDHIIPLCANGRDHPDNMQWQTREEAKLKDRKEREVCQR